MTADLMETIFNLSEDEDFPVTALGLGNQVVWLGIMIDGARRYINITNADARILISALQTAITVNRVKDSL